MKTTRSGGGIVSALIIGIVALMIIPLPGLVLDFLLAINIALSVTLLLTTVLASRSLDLASFPSLLLIATLFRLGAQRQLDAPDPAPRARPAKSSRPSARSWSAARWSSAS